ncbi:MAG: hypothetical protein ACTHK2_16985 [Dokdonella sp.]|uniref:hypothetical protein n=1 Tax=Dokdonella sp. TaxID=2291710 RepID=UPI003F821E9E
MACFPKIDQPCPLGIDAQRRIAGFCNHCSKAVHGLDAMSDAERIAFVRNAPGPICVSYRLRRGVALGLGVALAISVAVPGQADPVGTEIQATVSAGAASTAPTPPEEPQVLLMGGVSDPKSAAMVDGGDDDVPELPIVHEAGAR